MAVLSLLTAMLPSNLFASLFLLYCTYWLAISIYRLYLHPLSHFPGPKLAALSFWYEFYYDLYPHHGRYLWKLQQLHSIYGPIIRINPTHIHIDDPDFLDQIYTGAAHKRDRCAWFYDIGDWNDTHASALQTMDDERHRKRRAALNPLFSKRSIAVLEPLVKSRIGKLLARLEGERTRGTVVCLNYAYGALAMDIVTAYCFGTDLATLEQDEYGRPFADMQHEGAKVRPAARQFPTLFYLLKRLPVAVMVRFNKGIGLFAAYIGELERDVDRILKTDSAPGVGSEIPQTIFHAIKDSELPPQEKGLERLVNEAVVILGAGTETTARTLSVISYYLAEQPETLKRLREELRTVMPSPDSDVTLGQLEQLPYLSGVVNEGLRCALSVSGRMPRIPTHETILYKQWTIPRGTPVSQSVYLIHMNPSIFPDPFAFRPERWIDNPQLTKYLFAFGRGSRICLGINLARSELFLATAHVFRRFDLEAHDVVEERDVFVMHDYLIGLTDHSSPGIRMKVVGTVE